MSQPSVEEIRTAWAILNDSEWTVASMKDFERILYPKPTVEEIIQQTLAHYLTQVPSDHPIQIFPVAIAKALRASGHLNDENAVPGR